MKSIFKVLGFVAVVLSLSFAPVPKKVIVIDAGHGGKDTGQIEASQTEKAITLQVAKKIKALNTDGNIEIILTRDTDEFMSLSDRTDFINNLNPDMMISLHVNAYKEGSKNGIDLFVCDKSDQAEQSKALATKLEGAFQNDFSVSGVKNANFYILKNTNCPTAMIELGFLTNPTDREFLTSEKGQDKMAKVIYETLK